MQKTWRPALGFPRDCLSAFKVAWSSFIRAGQLSAQPHKLGLHLAGHARAAFLDEHVARLGQQLASQRDLRVPLSVSQHINPGGPAWPACVDAETAAKFLGWPPYFMPLLARVGHLKPLGKPAQNARKWYAMVELEQVSRDAVWLDKAIRIVDRLVREANGKQKGKGPGVTLAA